MLGHEIGQDFLRRFPAQDLSRSAVEQAGDVVEDGLAEGGQIRALGQELAQQPVGFLVATPLPGGVRVSEPDIELEALGQFAMTGHLRTPVIGQALTQEGRHLAQLTGEALEGVLGRATVHPAQHDEAGLALDQRAHGRAVEGALDEVAFPAPRQLPVLDFLGVVDDGPAAPVRSPARWQRSCGDGHEQVLAGEGQRPSRP